MKQVLGVYCTRMQSVLHQFHVVLCKSWTVEIIQLYVSIFNSLPDALVFRQAQDEPE